jgi:hypothetical protein
MMRFIVVLSTVLTMVMSGSIHAIAQMGDWASFYFAEAIPRRVDAWLVVAPPKALTPPYGAANFSHPYAWRVALEEGQVVAEVAPAAETQTLQLPMSIRDKARDWMHLGCFQVADGWLIGSDRSDGSDLWWYSSDGAKHYPISHDHVTCFVNTPAGLFVFVSSGWEFPGKSHGSVRRLTKVPHGHWSIQTYANLDAAPKIAIVEDDNSLLIATVESLVRIKPNKRVQTLVKNAFWWALDPISIVKTPSGVIYLGLHFGIVRILPKENQYKVEWLLPNKAFVAEMNKAIMTPLGFR